MALTTPTKATATYNGRLAGGGVVRAPSPIPLATPTVREDTTVGKGGLSGSKSENDGGGEHLCWT